MSLVFMDGFENYGTVNSNSISIEQEGERVWHIFDARDVTVNAMTLTTGRVSGLAVKGAGIDSVDFRLAYTNPNDDANITVGFSFFIPTYAYSTDTGSGYPHSLLDIGSGTYGAPQFAINYDLDGSLMVYRGITLIGRTFRKLKNNVWHYIELKIYVHNTLGTIDIWLDGENIFTYSGDTQGYDGSMLTRSLVLHTDTNSVYDDVYIATGNTWTRTNGAIVETLTPTSDSGIQDWTPSSGSNHYALVDDAPVNEGDYISSNTVNQQDLWGFSNLSQIDANVYGLQLSVGGHLEKPGKRTIQMICASNGSNATSNTNVIDRTTQVDQFIVENDPSTNSAWTVNAVNAAEFGIKVVS